MDMLILENSDVSGSEPALWFSFLDGAQGRPAGQKTRRQELLSHKNKAMANEIIEVAN